MNVANEATLAKNIRKINENVWQADTAREALAWLRIHLYNFGNIAHFSDGENGTTVNVPHKIFFRGQSNSTWSPIPSLLRLTGHWKREASLATKIFCGVLDNQFGILWSRDGTQSWPPFCKDFAEATAQHYGMRTTLLDWTVNPSSAIDFATRSGDRASNEPAAVFWISSKTAEKHNLKIILAPPFIRRLYIQRGFFTKLTKKQANELNRECERIEFPAFTHLPVTVAEIDKLDKEFEFDLLPEDDWINDLKLWSQGEAAEIIKNNSQINLMGLSIKFTQKYGLHPLAEHFSSDPINILSGDTIFYPILDYINQMALRFTNKETSCYDPRVLNILRKGNKDFFKWLSFQKIKLNTCY